jgi:periplasmic divalent cation tolerance protein
VTSGVVIVLTTFPEPGAATAFARTLVEERLAACVNVLPPMQSAYRWEGRIEEARESQLVIKTSLARLDALRRRMTELHPYEVPELLVIDVAQVAEPYRDWLLESVQPHHESA